tara:strand:- start:776 stop:949 length:174 start_codon:yes stop_codon:yes gene_type:complete
MNIGILKRVDVNTPKKVDINVLMSKAREEQKKINKQNLILVSGVVSSVLVLGIFFSL